MRWRQSVQRERHRWGRSRSENGVGEAGMNGLRRHAAALPPSTGLARSPRLEALPLPSCLRVSSVTSECRYQTFYYLVPLGIESNKSVDLCNKNGSNSVDFYCA